MSTIDQEHVGTGRRSRRPTSTPASRTEDELAAVDYLTRVFQFIEKREARMEFDGNYLCWLRVGTGVVMLGHANVEVHLIHSPLEAGLTTVMLNVYVHDIDAHYAHARGRGGRHHDGPRRRVLRRAPLRGDRSRGPPVALRGALRRHRGPRWPPPEPGDAPG